MSVQAISAVDTTQVRNVPDTLGQQGYSYLLNEPIQDEVCFQGNHKEDGKKHTFGKVVGWTLGAAALIATLSLGATHGVSYGKLAKGTKLGNTKIGGAIRDFLEKGLEYDTYFEANVIKKGEKNILRKCIPLLELSVELLPRQVFLP